VCIWCKDFVVLMNRFWLDFGALAVLCVVSTHFPLSRLFCVSPVFGCASIMVFGSYLISGFYHKGLLFKEKGF
jgi:hypothetical protein